VAAAAGRTGRGEFVRKAERAAVDPVLKRAGAGNLAVEILLPLQQRPHDPNGVSRPLTAVFYPRNEYVFSSVAS
jgi:hypothetical protein